MLRLEWKSQGGVVQNVTWRFLRKQIGVRLLFFSLLDNTTDCNFFLNSKATTVLFSFLFSCSQCVTTCDVEIFKKNKKSRSSKGGKNPKGGNIRRVIELLWESESSAARAKKKVVVAFFWFFFIFFIPSRAILTIECHRLQIVYKLGVVRDSAEGEERIVIV